MCFHIFIYLIAYWKDNIRFRNRYYKIMNRYLGLGYVASPILLSELAPNDKRGALVACTCLMTHLGLCLGFLGGYLFNLNDDKNNWRYLIGIGIIPPIIIIVFLRFIPESPRWLILKN